MVFCGNFIELVDKQRLLDDINDFTLWDDLEGKPDIEVYIEKDIIPELEAEDSILIDAVVGTLPNNDKFGFLFIKNQNENVYRLK